MYIHHLCSSSSLEFHILVFRFASFFLFFLQEYLLTVYHLASHDLSTLLDVLWDYWSAVTFRQLPVTSLHWIRTIWLPGFNLHRRQWSLLNRFRTGQGHCNACHKNGVSPAMNYVTVEKSRQCHTSSTLVHWPNLMAVYCTYMYMKQMRLPSTGWQHMALSTRLIIMIGYAINPFYFLNSSPNSHFHGFKS